MKDAAAVARALRAIIEPYATRLTVTADGPDGYTLDTRYVEKYRKPIFFGGVRRGKSYVSYYLMPLYTCPDLLKQLSPALRKRMQGKSCFNFTEIDEELFAELRAVTAAAFARFEEEGYI